jgi:hypothetical protein
LVVFNIGSWVYACAWLDCDSPIYVSHMAGMTGAQHHAKLCIGWDGVLWTFCLGWLQTINTEIFTSQVARITGVNLRAQCQALVISSCVLYFFLSNDFWCTSVPLYLKWISYVQHMFQSFVIILKSFVLKWCFQIIYVYI